MTGFLDRLAAYLHGEAPRVALRPRVARRHTYPQLAGPAASR